MTLGTPIIRFWDPGLHSSQNSQVLGKGENHVHACSDALFHWRPGHIACVGDVIRLMAEILHQLRLVVYPIIYRVSAPSQVVIARFQPSTVGHKLSRRLHRQHKHRGWSVLPVCWSSPIGLREPQSHSGQTSAGLVFHHQGRTSPQHKPHIPWKVLGWHLLYLPYRHSLRLLQLPRAQLSSFLGIACSS